MKSKPFYQITILFFIIILNSQFSILNCYAQSPNCFRITFTDKENSPYSIDRPEEFLSPRAIAKRTRFSIPVTEQDLPINPSYIESLWMEPDPPEFEVVSTSKWNNSVVIYFHGSDNDQNYIEFLINTLPYIKSVLPVAYIPYGKNSETSMQEQVLAASGDLTSCDYDYGISLENINLNKGQNLHKVGFCGEGMLICVFDAGWNNFNSLPYFKPLFDNGQIWGTCDLAPQENNVYTGHSHGTSVTSIMASAIDGQMVGTAPKANYYFIRSENPWFEQLIEEDWWAQAAELADSLGADVINSSLGYTNFDYDWQNIYTPDDNDGTQSICSRAATILAQKGVIVVNSAGNEGNSDWHYIGRPADAKNILAVGAANKDGVIAGFSSYGPTADGRIKPDVVSVGWNTWNVRSDGSIGQGNGTSFAGPVIAGLSACLWQALPQYSSVELMQIMRQYSDRANNPDDRSGYGIPNFSKIYSELNISEKKFSSFEVYPNPTSGKLTMGNGELTIKNIELFDIMGKKLFTHLMSQVSNPITFNISHLSSGIYFLKIQTDNFMEVVKIIKK